MSIAVDVGQTVAASFSAPILFTLAVHDVGALGIDAVQADDIATRRLGVRDHPGRAPQHARHEREMIILDEDDRVVARRFGRGSSMMPYAKLRARWRGSPRGAI